MTYQDYLKKAGIKQKKIKGFFKDYKNLSKRIPSELGFNNDGSLQKQRNKLIITI